jgi:chitinase
LNKESTPNGCYTLHTITLESNRKFMFKASFQFQVATHIQRLLNLILAVVLIACSGDEMNTNKLPSVHLVIPVNESIIKNTGPIQLQAEASDDDGTINKVQFVVNNNVVGESTASPFVFSWTPTETGNYAVKARAIDDKDGTSESVLVSFTATGFSCTEEDVCATFTPISSSQVVMAFYPSWKTGQLPMASIPWGKITHIIYCFALPVASGELSTGDIDGNIDQLVTSAHANGVKVYFSIGGGVGSDPFIPLSENARTRALFVDRIRCYIKDHCLDGVDIDWEHWNGEDKVIPAESDALVAFLTDLRASLNENIEISIDVAASNWSGKNYEDGVVNQVTYINAMLYDLRGPWSEPGPHSAYNEVITDGTNNSSINSWGLQYWNGYRKWPASKTVIGIPFYGRDFNVNNGEGVDYRQIVARVKSANADINADRIGNTWYDGPLTAGKKAAYARDHNYAGVMFWELTGDTNENPYSLLEAINTQLN